MDDRGRFTKIGHQQAGLTAQNAMPPPPPAAEQAINRLLALVERGIVISDRQQRFLDRMRGAVPQDVSKTMPGCDPISILARFDNGLNDLETIINRFLDHTDVMETLA